MIFVIASPAKGGTWRSLPAGRQAVTNRMSYINGIASSSTTAIGTPRNDKFFYIVFEFIILNS